MIYVFIKYFLKKFNWMFENRQFFMFFLCFFLILINGFEKQFFYVFFLVIDMN